MKKWIAMFVVVVCFFIANTSDVSAKSKGTICIDPGHQRHQNLGTEPIAPGSSIRKTKVSSGTAGVVTKKPEYQLTLELGLKLKKSLKKKGYKVCMTRTKNNVNITNVQRATYCNQKKADLTVRIHADGSTNRATQGLTVLYPSNSKTKAINKKSKKTAKVMMKQLIKKTKAKKGYGTGLMARNDLSGFNWSKTPVVLVEVGFMSNPTEDRKLSKKSYQRKLVSGMVRGIQKTVK
ncbi:N-acetylmuramoyl-L-alanine amidase [Kurthia massiliensis]|uniref:N-acetylmuramoyl-L-alanine amidase n=1 Tax=Kurthia massiliensis TaxID=1033739 RepID=UPI0002896943|nr:N-acetylmuramoyl-L-alanine amidase [Kurthia massiliensis]